VKPLLAAFGLFAALAAALGVFWTLVLGVAMEGVWGRLPEGWSSPVGAAALAFAVLSGLALYLFVLARVLGALGVPPRRVPLHLATTALVPPAAAAAAIWAAIANMRIGW
jgi:hypothetical protein